MGRREQVAIHQIPRIMSFTPDEMVARMDESGVDVSLWLSTLPAFLRRALSAEAHQSEVS